jgi:hypothetical protein
MDRVMSRLALGRGWLVANVNVANEPVKLTSSALLMFGMEFIIFEHFSDMSQAHRI